MENEYITFLEKKVAALEAALASRSPDEGAQTGDQEEAQPSLTKEYDLIRSPERLEAVAAYLWNTKSPPSSVSFSEVNGVHRERFINDARTALEGDMFYRTAQTVGGADYDRLTGEFIGKISEERLSDVSTKWMATLQWVQSPPDVVAVVEKILQLNDEWYRQQEALGVRAVAVADDDVNEAWEAASDSTKEAALTRAAALLGINQEYGPVEEIELFGVDEGK